MHLYRRYLPLEVLNGQLGQLHKADMFALGATLLELATRSELPSGGQQYQDLRAGRLPLLPTYTQRFARMIRCAELSWLAETAARAGVDAWGRNLRVDATCSNPGGLFAGLAFFVCKKRVLDAWTLAGCCSGVATSASRAFQ